MPSTAPAQGPLGGRRPTPELHACPMLSVRVCSPPPWPSGTCTTLPAAPLPLAHFLETCPFCFSILPSLLFIVMVVSRLGRRRGSGPHSQRLCLSQSPWPPPSRPHVAQRPLPLPSSPQPRLTGGFGGGLCLFLCKRKKKAFSFVKGWLCFGDLLFSWFCLVFISPGISSLYLVTSPFFSPALSSSTDATRWQF